MVIMEKKLIKIRDEKGQGYDMIGYQDLLLPAAFFQTSLAVEKKLLAIKQIEYKEGDVFLCGYPKCGNHWMSNLITYMQHPGPVESKMSVNIPLVDIYSVKELKQQPYPRLFTTHFKFNRLPQQHVEKNGKVILLLRNPKDVAVSYFYHLKHWTLNNQQSWEHYLQSFLEGKVINGSYFNYLDSWTTIIQLGTFQNLLIVYYEDLVQDCLHQLKRIQSFLGTTNSESRLMQIVDRCSIDRLRSDVNSGDLKTLLTNMQGESHIYRKGKVGDWQAHFTVSQNALFDKQIKLRLKDSIFEFRYDSCHAASKL